MKIFPSCDHFLECTQEPAMTFFKLHLPCIIVYLMFKTIFERIKILINVEIKLDIGFLPWCRHL